MIPSYIVVVCHIRSRIKALSFLCSLSNNNVILFRQKNDTKILKSSTIYSKLRGKVSVSSKTYLCTLSGFFSEASMQSFPPNSDFKYCFHLDIIINCIQLQLFPIRVSNLNLTVMALIKKYIRTINCQ